MELEHCAQAFLLGLLRFSDVNAFFSDVTRHFSDVNAKNSDVTLSFSDVTSKTKLIRHVYTKKDEHEAHLFSFY